MIQASFVEALHCYADQGQPGGLGGGAAERLAREGWNLAQNSNWRFGIIMVDFYFLADFGVPDLG